MGQRSVMLSLLSDSCCLVLYFQLDVFKNTPKVSSESRLKGEFRHKRQCLIDGCMTACPPEMLEDADWQASIPVLIFSKLVDADCAPRLEVSPVW